MWLYEGKEFVDPADYFGFVYLIENKLTGKKYIGRKLFTKAGYKQVKGKKKKIRKESDWKTYFSSSPALLKDKETWGESCFDKKILKLCRSRGECNYYETKYLFNFEVLEKYSDKGEPLYYNDIIQCKIHRSTIKKKDTPMQCHKPES